MADETKEVVIQPGALDDDARRDYAKVFGPKCDTTDGMKTIDECFAGAEFVDGIADGKVVLRYALKREKWENGAEVFVVAAVGGVAGADLVRDILPLIEKQCAPVADYVTIKTRRPGLVKKLMKQGYEISAFAMRKKLDGYRKHEQ